MSSSQIFSQTASIESMSYQDSLNTTHVNPPIIKKERTKSIGSNSSLLSIKSQRKRTPSNISLYSKAQKTVDTEPFTIDSPVHSAKIENISHNNQLPIRDESIHVRRQSLPKAAPQPMPRASPEIKPEEKAINNE